MDAATETWLGYSPRDLTQRQEEIVSMMVLLTWVNPNFLLQKTNDKSLLYSNSFKEF